MVACLLLVPLAGIGLADPISVDAVFDAAEFDEVAQLVVSIVGLPEDVTAVAEILTVGLSHVGRGEFTAGAIFARAIHGRAPPNR